MHPCCVCKFLPACLPVAAAAHCCCVGECLQIAALSALNDKLTRLAHGLRDENSSLHSALDQAAYERKALEAAAALEHSKAESSALVGAAAAHHDAVLQEVGDLARGQQQLVALVCEVREELLGLVGEHHEAAAASGSIMLGHVGEPDSSGLLPWLNVNPSARCQDDSLGNCGSDQADASGMFNGSHKPAVLYELVSGSTRADDADAGLATLFSTTADSNGRLPLQQEAAAEGAERWAGSKAEAAAPAGPLCEGTCSLRRLNSVKGNVTAALAATVSDALQL
jgi:hypothetical protein